MIAGTWIPNDPASFIQPDSFPNDKGIGDTRGTATNSLTATSDLSNRQWKDTVKLAGSYHGRWGLLAAADFWLQTGEWSGPIRTRVSAADPRFGPTTVVLSNGRRVSNPLATTTRFAYPTRGEEQLRLPAVKSLNLRVGWEFRIRGTRLETAVDVFNVFNWDHYVWFEIGGNELYSSFYGKGRNLQQPRAGQFSVRFAF